MDKGKSAMPLLAIVAIVAVVAVVMVVLQGRTPSSEEAVAGEATRLRAKLDCKTFLNTQILGDEIKFAGETYDSLCIKQGYDQCVGITYFGSLGPGPYRDVEEKVAKTMAMPGTCELSFAGETWGVASYFDVSPTDDVITSTTDFGFNVEVDCCRLK